MILNLQEISQTSNAVDILVCLILFVHKFVLILHWL